MIDKIIDQYIDTLCNLQTAEAKFSSYLNNIQSYFTQDLMFEVNSSIDEQEDTYKLLSCVNNMKSTATGAVTRLKQIGARTTKLRSQYEKVCAKLSEDSVKAYKLLHILSSYKIPKILNEVSSIVYKSVKKEVTSSTHSTCVSTDDQNNIMYKCIIKNNDMQILLSMSIDSAGNGSDITTDITGNCCVKEPVENLVTAAKGKINIINVNKEKLREYDPVICDNYVILTVTGDDSFEHDEAGRSLSVKPNVYVELVDKIVSATGVTKDKLRYFTKLNENSAEIHFRIS